MYARVTRYKMKPGSVDAARAEMERSKADIMAQPGMLQFVNVMNPDGSGYIVALVESRERSEANAETVRELWGRFKDHLEAAPAPEGFEVIADWKSA